MKRLFSYGFDKGIQQLTYLLHMQLSSIQLDYVHIHIYNILV